MDLFRDFFASYRWYDISCFNEDCAMLSVSDLDIASNQTGFAISNIQLAVKSPLLECLNERESLQTRVMWIELVKKDFPWKYNVPRGFFQYILEKYSVRTGYEYAHTAAAGVFEIQYQPTDGSKTFCAFMPTIFGVTWKYDPDSAKTRAIWWGDQWVLDTSQKILSYTQPIAKHPIMPAVVSSTLLCHLTERDLASFNIRISKIENSTGFHPWKYASYGIAKEAQSNLFTETSSIVTAFAGIRRICKVNEQILDFIVTFNTKEKHASSTDSIDGRLDRLVLDSVELIKQRLAMQTIQLDFLCKRLDVQHSTLSYLMNQRQTNVSMAVAQDSRSIALASKRDSSAMTALTAGTAFFLPGTFVASLFAMPLFQWNAPNAEDVVSSRFWIYWVVTSLLTILTLGVWSLWARRRSAGIRLEDSRGLNKLASDIETKQG